MRLLILANTLPILVEANDQGPLTAPQLFSPSCASCARAEIAKTQRRQKCEANLVIEEDVWGKGSCLSSTPYIQRTREGEKQTSHLSDDVDSGVWSEGTTDKESVGDTKEEEVDIPNTNTSQERTVNGTDRAEEASAFLEEVQRVALAGSCHVITTSPTHASRHPFPPRHPFTPCHLSTPTVFEVCRKGSDRSGWNF